MAQHFLYDRLHISYTFPAQTTAVAATWLRLFGFIRILGNDYIKSALANVNFIS